MTNQEKQELFNYIKNNPYDTPREIQIFCGGCLATIRKYQKIVKKMREEEDK